MMKKLFSKIITVLVIVSAAVFVYVLYKNGLIGSVKITANTQTQTNDGRQRNLDWMGNIPGVSESDKSNQATATSTDLTATSTTDATSTDNGTSATGTSATTSTSPTPNGTAEDGSPRTIENIGKADALTSTAYDHAQDKLILNAEFTQTGIKLDWNPSASTKFTAYQVVRSVGDANPYSPKTNAIATIKDISYTSFTDPNVTPDTVYYYRICFTKSSGLPGCGNILKIKY